MAQCCYETLLSSRAFSCEGVHEDVGRASHVEAFHCKIRIPGKSPIDSPENPYYCIAHLATVQLCQRNFEREDGVVWVNRVCWLKK